MSAPAEVVTFGEALGVFLAPPAVPLRAARDFRRTIAGAELNVAVGLARLGRRARWIGRVGADPFGDDIRATLRAEGVDATGVIVDEHAATGLIVRDQHPERSVEVAYHRAGSAGSRLRAADVEPHLAAGVRLLHATGITPALSPDARAATLRAVDVARERGIAVSFDPNYRSRLWPESEAVPVLRELCARADIVLVGRDEARMLTGSDDPATLTAWFLERGARIVVLKDGAAGAWVSDAESRHRVPALPVRHPVDPVGAGDAFAAGFLAAWLAGAPLERCGQEGAAVGAACVQASGDLAGLPDAGLRDAMIDGDQEVRR